MQLGPEGDVGEDPPGHVHFGDVVVLHEVRVACAGRLDLLVAVADGREDDGAVVG
jgi:hypothetical protein